MPEETDVRQAGESMGDFLGRRKLARMRMGQSYCEPVSLISDNDVQFWLVPLTAAESERSLKMAMEVDPVNQISGVLHIRIKQTADLWMALRDFIDKEKRAFLTREELMSSLDEVDIDYLIERYDAMVAEISPSIYSISPEKEEELKNSFGRIRMSALSGGQWVRLWNFLFTLQPNQLMGNSLGFTSTDSLIGTSDEPDESTSHVFTS